MFVFCALQMFVQMFGGTCALNVMNCFVSVSLVLCFFLTVYFRFLSLLFKRITLLYIFHFIPTVYAIEPFPSSYTCAYFLACTCILRNPVRFCTTGESFCLNSNVETFWHVAASAALLCSASDSLGASNHRGWLCECLWWCVLWHTDGYV